MEGGGYTITYNTKGGVNHADNPDWYDELTTAITLKNPAREGYTFVSWCSDAKLRKPVTEIPVGSKKNINLYAKWKVNKYTVEFDGNGCDSGNMSKLAGKTYGKKFTLKSNAFEKKGYTFAGWNTKQDGTGTHYKNKASVLNLATEGSITLYAQWIETVYKIAYNLRSGKQNPANPLTYNINSDTITLAEPTRKGYTFVGWYSNSRYRDFVAEIKTGSTGNIKLYAKWKRKTGRNS